jgi:hypothetical protein
MAKHSLEVSDESSNGVDFNLAPDTRISGRVFDPDGHPMKGVCLDIEPLQGNSPEGSRIFSCTKPDGSYLLDQMPAGNYRIVANPRFWACFRQFPEDVRQLAHVVSTFVTRSEAPASALQEAGTFFGPFGWDCITGRLPWNVKTGGLVLGGQPRSIRPAH